jgi:hypothetical protein
VLDFPEELKWRTEPSIKKEGKILTAKTTNYRGICGYLTTGWVKDYTQAYSTFIVQQVLQSNLSCKQKERIQKSRNDHKITEEEF